MRKSDQLFICVFVLLVGGLLLIGAPVNAQTCGVSQPLQLVSVALDGTPGGGTIMDVNNISISADGRYIAFTSYADNLVNGDTNQKEDVFVRDMVTGVTERVSVGPNGLEANGASKFPSISGDGNLVAFQSEATNLVPGTTCPILQGCVDIFVYNRQTKTTILVSALTGSNLQTGLNYYSVISGNGRYVAFSSVTADFVTGDTNDVMDVFVRDLQTGTIERVSVASTGTEGNDSSVNPRGISWDGRYISFESFASNLVENDHNAQCDYNSYFPDEPCLDVFVHDRVTHETKRASVASDGTETNGSLWWHSLSHDGRYVSFASLATNLASEDTDGYWDIYIHDSVSGTTQLASVKGGAITMDNPSGETPSFSFYGRYLAFSAPTNALSIVVRDTWTNHNIHVSRAMNGQIENGQAFYPVISADGQHVAFWSSSSNLVPGDTNDQGDIFVAALDCPADRTPFTPSPPDAVPTRNYATGDITLTWNRISWAAQYRIQVDTDKAFQSEFIVNELVGADQLEKTLTGLDPNTYYWRVQALDANNKAGGWSAVESFTIGYPE